MYASESLFSHISYLRYHYCYYNCYNDLSQNRVWFHSLCLLNHNYRGTNLAHNILFSLGVLRALKIDLPVLNIVTS